MLKRHFNNIKKLSNKLLVCMIIPMTIILTLTAGICIQAVTTSMTNFSMQQLRTDATAKADRLSSYLNNYMVNLSSKSSSYTLERYMKTLTWSNNPTTNPYHYQLMNTLDDIRAIDPETISMAWIADFDSGIGIGDTDSKWQKNASDWQLSHCPWYQQAMTTKHAFISNPYISLYQGLPVVSVIVPIEDSVNHRILGILSMDLRLEKIRSLIETTPTDTPSITMVLDSHNKFVSHPNMRQLLHSAEEADNPVDRLGAETEDIYGLFSYEKNQTDYLGYACPVQDTSWTIISVVEKSVIARQLLPLIVQLSLIFILSLLLFGLIVSSVSRFITKPLEEITVATKEIANGNYTMHLISSSQDEVGQLAVAADTAIQTLRNRAMFDSLTGIYNEFAFSSRANYLINTYPDNQYALIRFDIARFKMINDMFGTARGDEFLKFIASVIQDHVSLDDGYGRISGDIFCIFFRYDSEKDILDLIRRITYHVEAFPINFNLTPYFGVCLAAPNISVSTLLDWSSLALNTIKGSKLGNYAFYDGEMRENLLIESRIENEMFTALNEKQFQVFLQPKCDITTSRVIGAEALVRWIHPTRGLIRPDLFIPLFERNGFIIKLDEYIWEETCKLISEWMKKGYPLVPVSVNVSRVHIFDPEFCDKITNLVYKYDIPFHLLELEFTESSFVANSDELYHLMSILKKRGFTLLMDDFGSGYSSLNMLKNSPVDIIKLDREFLNESSTTENGRIIINSTISMILKLKKQIIAEGVETAEQAHFLLNAGCSIAQGYYYSKPIDIPAFEEFSKMV